ncbi:hypothetical protein HNV08_06765 [Winogradskyella eckloniae]|uniref:hypothetical protein n=1 Tax=Winogradskyella eckloniae TaxID=1089306 RepID=UPI001565B4D3|nr:hypothetical protein [Winogradskyella eckloniae]NRD19745.1 hypothetical protein [Winogradskyella eckloniae]
MKKEHIHNIKSSGFKTPDNYFNSIDDQILGRINKSDALSGIEAPGFTVPSSYFDTVEASILEKIEDKAKTPVIQLKPRRTLYYVAGIAASLLLLIGLVFNNEEELSLNTIDTASIENYLYQEEYSYDELATLFKTEDISETDFIDISISEDYLDSYLENIDTEDFILD